MSPEAHKLSPAGKDCSAAAAELLRAHREQERAEHFEEAAKLVEAAGCICHPATSTMPTRGRYNLCQLVEHDASCPRALAAMLREKGGIKP